MAYNYFRALRRECDLREAVEASRDVTGRPVPSAAGRIAARMGYTSIRDTCELGLMLKAAGAFRAAQ